MFLSFTNPCNFFKRDSRTGFLKRIFQNVVTLLGLPKNNKPGNPTIFYFHRELKQGFYCICHDVLKTKRH